MHEPGTVLRDWLTALPKAELHLHLDGSLRPQTALELARDRDIGLDVDGMDVRAMRELLVAPERCADQAELLRAFELPTALLQDVESLRRCTRELIEDVAGDGTSYVEIRWAPSLHTELGLPLHDGIAAVVEAARETAESAGITVRLIAVALRTHEPERGAEVARTALEFVADGLTGFDLAGLEQDYPDPRRFERAFDIAREGGLGITCHAGEWGGPAQVRAALAVRPARIAHGAPAADDPDLMDELIRRGVTVDVCPTSNIQAGLEETFESHPLPTLLRRGVPVTISTDDRTVSDLTLVREMERAVLRLGVTLADIETLTRHAYKVAFLHHDEELRRALQERLEAWISEHPATTAQAVAPAPLHRER